MSNNDPTKSIDSTFNSTVTRREFIKYTAGTAACISFGSLTYGCGSNHSTILVAGYRYPIDSTVVKTTERMITFPYLQPVPPLSTGMPASPNPSQSPNGGTTLNWNELDQVSKYDSLGYGKWEYLDQPLPIVPRTDIAHGDPSTTVTNAVTLSELVDKLQSNTNLLMWIAGHRHVNHVKALNRLTHMRRKRGSGRLKARLCVISRSSSAPSKSSSTATTRFQSKRST